MLPPIPTPHIDGLTLLLGVCAVGAVAGVLMLLHAVHVAEAREQAMRREAEFLARTLMKSVGLLMDYDSALMRGDSSGRAGMAEKVSTFNRHAVSSLESLRGDR